ncbi:MAG: hypothetical protein OHK0048_23870 [Rhodoferax sp.]
MTTSTLKDGVVSVVNPQAQALGVEPGMTVAEIVARWCSDGSPPTQRYGGSAVKHPIDPA